MHGGPLSIYVICIFLPSYVSIMLLLKWTVMFHCAMFSGPNIPNGYGEIVIYVIKIIICIIASLFIAAFALF